MHKIYDMNNKLSKRNEKTIDLQKTGQQLDHQ